jgi:hypothetical protein
MAASEQSKYTTVLTIFWRTILGEKDDYVFVPALRLSLRLSASARCAPPFGTDAVKDDQRYGRNGGGVGKFMGKRLRDQKLLSMVKIKDEKQPAVYRDNYDGMLGFPKSSWGDWRCATCACVVDIRRTVGFAAGYCYGSRVDYLDEQYYASLTEDAYESQLNQWKVFLFSTNTKPLDNYSNRCE